MMGFGFVVARFGLFLRVIAAQRTDSALPVAAPTHLANAIGIALVVLGAATLLVAAWQHRAFVAALPPADLPPSHHRGFPVLVALGLTVLGLLLAAHLAL
jgi:putative membrane protein